MVMLRTTAENGYDAGGTGWVGIGFHPSSSFLFKIVTPQDILGNQF
jgi:hypothetical protein